MNQWFLIAGLILFVLLSLFLMGYLFILKRQMKNAQKELARTEKESYNRQITVSLVDQSLTDLTSQINHNLDYQKELKKKAELSEQQLKQSISDIAHDLRTPLTVIKGNLQMMEREDLSPKSQEYLRICQDKADVLKTMVDDFFELAVLESDDQAVNLQKVDLTALALQFVIDHEAIIREKGITPRIQFPEKSIFVYADEDMSKRIFSNLLNNILKYAKSEFELSIEETDGAAVVVFSNQLEPGNNVDVNKLFDRTYRADQARSSTGAGLGLTIVKLLADKQQVRVTTKKIDDKLCVMLTHKVFPDNAS